MNFATRPKEEMEKPPCPRCLSADMVVISYDIIHAPEKGEWWYISGIYCTRPSCEKMIVPGIIQ